VSLLPLDDEPDLLGSIFIGGEQPPEHDEARLASAIANRHTVRERFDPRVLREVDLEALRAAASVPEAWVRFVNPHEDQVALAVLLARADDVELAEPRYLEELSAWLRPDESSGDGVSPAAVGKTPVSQRASSLRLRDFLPGSASGASKTAEEPPPPEHPLPVIIGTVGDDPRSWLVAGEALVRLLLEATCRGIGASPMTQVLEVPALRKMLSGALGLLGYPQMLLRLGYKTGGTVTRRRPLSEVLSYET
jgi:nitroreductase